MYHYQSHFVEDSGQRHTKMNICRNHTEIITTEGIVCQDYGLVLDTNFEYPNFYDEDPTPTSNRELREICYRMHLPVEPIERAYHKLFLQYNVPIQCLVGLICT